MTREPDPTDSELGGASPEPADRLKAALARVLALDPADREHAISKMLPDDPELAAELRSLLQHTGDSAPWPEGPLFTLRQEELPPSLPVGTRVGPYKITGQLGEGGMGSVAKAVREDDFSLQVAIKVVRRGTVSDASIGRFQEERQILAQLSHPNIARILDGGETSEGLPFFALEYVDGLPIDRYLDQHSLPVTERVQMFVKVCSALSVAHRNLIIHRDLKPSNILVDKAGEPKLVDFGIATRLHHSTEAAPRTEAGLLPMTVRYASPEQLRGAVLTTRSDVYSLGVILYELLSGKHPFAAATNDTLTRVRSIGEPKSEELGTTGGITGADHLPREKISGDLDAIVLKAISPKPEDRYRSVDDLADDLTAYLEGKPVLARAGSWTYRFAKFARRQRAALLTAGLILLLIVGSAVATTILWRQAVADRARAVAERERSAKVLVFTKDLFWTASEAPDGGPEMTAQEILKRAEKALESEVEDPLLQADLLNNVGEVLVNLGLLDEALPPLEKAESILRAQFPDGHPDLAQAINNRAAWFFRARRYEEAEPLYREALAMKRALHSIADCESSLVKSTSNLASILMSRGAFDEAERHYLQVLACRRSSEAADSPVLARTLRSLGLLYHHTGRLVEAEPLMRRALEIREASYGPQDHRVASALSSLGRVLTSTGAYDEAHELLTRALGIRIERYGPDHPHTALTQLDLVQLMIDWGKAEEGLPLLRAATETLRGAKSTTGWELARAESLEGWYLAQEGRLSEAANLMTTAYETLARVRGAGAVYTRQAEKRLRELDRQRSGGELGAPTREQEAATRPPGSP